MTDREPDGERSDPTDLPVDGDTVLRYDPETGAYRAEFDPTALPPSLLVPLAVAALRDAAPETLPALHYSLDPTALDGICTPDTGAEATFAYAGYRFTLDGTGVLRVAGTED
ncbi:HalOD1 output domain-containing protein [Halobaculum sp. EA56]|uniref:HalOD1 output domain-containing protein n=1 Tax=Halobaculum sp. EA56 TaxID=3421648 RepID=UPI003EC06FD4